METKDRVAQAVTSSDAVQHMRKRTKRFFSLKPVEEKTQKTASDLYQLEGKVRNILSTKQNKHKNPKHQKYKAFD